MRIFKISVISIVVSIVIFFAFKKSRDINIEGTWKPTKIVLNDEDMLSSDTISKFFDLGNEVIVSNWGDSICISLLGRPDIHVGFVIDEGDKNNKQITLSSKDKSLNGKFNLEIDTIHIGPQAYRVYVRIKSNKTYLNFERAVIIPPWKPEFPRRGQV